MWKLWILVCKASDQDRLDSMESDEIIEKLGLKGKNPKNYLNKLSSNLYSFILTFLALDEWQNDMYSQKLFTLKSLRKRSLDGLFKIVIKRERIGFYKERAMDDAAFEFQYQMEMEYGEYLFERSRTSHEEQLNIIWNNLLKSVTSKLLKLSISWTNHEMVFPSLSGAKDFSIIGRIINDNDIDYPDLIRARLEALRLLTGDASGDFLRLLRLVTSVETKLDRVDRHQLFTICMNDCLRRLNQGEEEAKNNVILLYNYGLESGLLIEDQKLQEHHLKNIISIWSKAGLIDEAKEKLDCFHPIISSSNPSVALQYNQSIIGFHERHYSETAKNLYSLIGKLKEDIFYVLDARAYRLMALFELGDDDTFDSDLASFRAYIRRGKLISARKKSSYNDFLGYIVKIKKWRHRRPEGLKKKILDLINQIQNSAIPNKNWLLNKIESHFPDVFSHI